MRTLSIFKLDQMTTPSLVWQAQSRPELAAFFSWAMGRLHAPFVLKANLLHSRQMMELNSAISQMSTLSEKNVPITRTPGPLASNSFFQTGFSPNFMKASIWNDHTSIIFLIYVSSFFILYELTEYFINEIISFSPLPFWAHSTPCGFTLLSLL